jgi:uncharacterized membrane protein
MVNGTPKSRPWMTIVLIVSLGLNLFLGSLMIGRWLSGPPHRHAPFARTERAPGAEANRFLERMASALPQEHRAGFEATFERHGERLGRAANEAREAREQVREALRKEPFDRAELDRAFETLRGRNNALQQEIQNAIAEGAAALPPDARERLADWRAHGRRR